MEVNFAQTFIPLLPLFFPMYDYYLAICSMLTQRGVKFSTPRKYRSEAKSNEGGFWEEWEWEWGWGRITTITFLHVINLGEEVSQCAALVGGWFCRKCHTHIRDPNRSLGLGCINVCREGLHTQIYVQLGKWGIQLDMRDEE